MGWGRVGWGGGGLMLLIIRLGFGLNMGFKIYGDQGFKGGG